jgi:hypothetical protein
MDGEVRRFDEDIGPNPSHQVLLADQLTATFKQSNQELQSATSDRHGLIAFKQKKLRRKQAKRSERNFRWGGAGRNGSLLEERRIGMRTVNLVADAKPGFGMELRQASES